VQSAKSAAITRKTIEQEILRRHKVAVTTVAGLLIAVLLLSGAAFLGKRFLREQNNPVLDIALRILIMFLGLGTIALRRTRFSSMRLQDIGALRGPTGLLHTLERTTLQVALLGAAIALIGFVGTLVTGEPWYTYTGGVVAVAVLLYCYPIRSSWQRTVRQFAAAETSDQL